MHTDTRSGETVHRPEHVVVLDVRHPHGMPGCTNGPTASRQRIMLAPQSLVAAYAAMGETLPPAWFEVVVNYVIGRPNVFVRPVASCPRDRIGYMHGGNTVDLTEDPALAAFLAGTYGTDLGADLPSARVHDRSETPAQYAALSSD